MELYYHGVDRDVLILSADGGIDSTNAEAVVTELGRLVSSGARKLIIDCSHLRYVSSYGLAVLFRLHKKLAEHGGEVKIAALQSRVTELIRLAGLEPVFQMYASVDDARAAFRT